MNKEFCIQFEYNGTHYKGEVMTVESGGYCVVYKIAGLELKPYVIFIQKKYDQGYGAYAWEQRKEKAALVDDEFIAAIGKALEHI